MNFLLYCTEKQLDKIRHNELSEKYIRLCRFLQGVDEVAHLLVDGSRLLVGREVLLKLDTQHLVLLAHLYIVGSLVSKAYREDFRIFVWLHFCLNPHRRMYVYCILYTIHSRSYEMMCINKQIKA